MADLRCQSGCAGTPVLHQRRKRQFLLLVACVVIPIMCLLCRYRCPVCGKTWTKLPKGVARHKRYVPVEMAQLGKEYMTEDSATYRGVSGDKQTSRFCYGLPANPSDFTPEQLAGFESRDLSHVTLYRWVGQWGASEPAEDMQLAQQIHATVCFGAVKVVPRKYRSNARRVVLRRCAKRLLAWSILRPGAFTHFGTGRAGG